MEKILERMGNKLGYKLNETTFYTNQELNEYDINPGVEVEIISKDQLIDLITGYKKVFTAVFIKKDGSERVMNCRLGVEKYLRGGNPATWAREKGYIIVFDMQINEYRTLNPATTEVLVMAGKTYSVDQTL